MSAVAFEHIGKTYPNGHTALNDFSLQIEEGEFMVVVGPSGCGKSTLLRILAGLEEISSGLLRIGGRIANTLTPQQRNIAMVFQDYALYPTMTVRGNLEFPLRMRKLQASTIRKRVQWVADLLDLGAVLDRLPKQLSGGQRQRVAMGRALVREPSVFLLDEPLSNLDARLRTQVRAEIADLQQRTAATLVYVTHDQVEAMTLGHRIAVLDQGRLQQVADPATLYDRPATPFVAGFIGSPPMNLFRTRWHQEAGDWSLEVGAQRLHWSPEDLQTSCKPTPGASFTAGVRPEALRLAGENEAGLQGRVINTEYLGHETLLHILPHGAEDASPWIMRLPGLTHYSRNTPIRFSLSAGSLHDFG